MALVVAAIFGVIIYRIVVVALLYTIEPDETIAKLGTSISALLPPPSYPVSPLKDSA